MASGREPVAPLAAMVGAHNLGKPEGAELEHLPVEVGELVQERAALATRS